MDIGIDLGTTYSVVAVKGKVDLAPGQDGEAQYLPEVDVTIIPSVDGNPTIPSVMWWHPDAPHTYVFGDQAKKMAEQGKSPIMFSKRSIGTNEKLMLNGRAFTAAEVAERFLRYMKEGAEKVTGQKVNRAVVTHPAYFLPNAVAETMQAAERAGLAITPEQMMMEPCAAALAYTVNDTTDPMRVMTYDLGGGTFDVAVMEKIQGINKVKKFGGNHLLGGYNFDSAFVQWILDELKARDKTIPYDEANEDHRGRRARMLELAESNKIKLGEQRTRKVKVDVQVDFLVDDHGKPVQFRGQINREQYAALIKEELESTIKCCHDTLTGAELDAKDLHAVLLVGGSTRGEWVVDAVTAAFGSIVSSSLYPDYMVAAGAALCVAQLPPPASVNKRVTLTLDYPARSVLPYVTISGAISPSPNSDLTSEACRKLRVRLKIADKISEALEIGPAGQFVFRGVELSEDGMPSAFTVSVLEKDTVLLPQEGQITYEGGGDVAPVPATPVPVLPRPLFLKADRLVPMAAEGAQLPAKCHVKLRRVFGGSSEHIPILLDSEQIGTVSVEDIPDEAGEGCLVVVDVEVTQSNEMRGKVVVYKLDGKTVAKEGEVRIAFPPTQIPELADLIGEFGELKDRLEMELVLAPPQDKARLAGPGKTLIRKITKIVEGQSPDKQILVERIKELRRIVKPPEDDMSPPWKDFESLLAEAREGATSDSQKPGLTAQIPALDRVETAGKDAHQTKNNKKWAAANGTLQHILSNIERELKTTESKDKKPPPLPSASVLKAQANRRIQALRTALGNAQAPRPGETGSDRWTRIAEEYARKIDHMASEIASIPDNAPSEQALAQVQSYLAPSEGLEKKIAQIAVRHTLTA